MTQRQSLEPQLVTADGYYRPPPALASAAPPPPPPSDDALRADLKALSADALLERCVAAERMLREWRAAAGDLVAALALAPEMTEALYARSLRELLSAALATLDAVDHLRHVECSMPSVRTEMPRVELARWAGLPYSEWRVAWAPASWWVSVSAVGSRWGLGFNCLTTVTDIKLSGTLRCAFSPDLTSLRMSFREQPALHMRVESAVGWGAVPLPVREQIEELVRAEIESFVESRLTGDDSMVVVLRRKALAKLSDEDIHEARLQAERAANVNLRAPTLL